MEDSVTILCAVDFSADSEAALLWACKQANRDDGRLVVLHVVHDPASSPGFYRKPDGDWLRPMEDVAREMFSEFLSDFHRQHPETAGLTPIETMVVRGLPSGRIVEVAEAVAADQVIVGSRGRTGLPHVLLGSVAHRVVQIARPPVTVVKAPRELAE
jgi:nucleotide-binding universal stress UspA family protein